MIKYFWLFLFVLLTTAASAQVNIGTQGTNVELDYNNPKEYRIGAVTVSGAKFLDPNTLISITGLRVGDRIKLPGEDLSKAIHKLWDQGILGNVEVSITKIEGDQVFLDFFLTERPRLSRFDFSGIKKGQADALRDKIKLIRGKVVTDALLSTTKNTVRNYFVEKGYMNAKVNVFQKPDSVLPNSVVLNIAVDKGNKVRIEEIAFEGNEAISDKKLRRKMKKTKEKRPYKLFTSSKFNRALYETDKTSVIDYYNSQGFRDATIVSDSVYMRPNGKLAIQIKVDEGNKYFYRNISWTGNYIYDAKQLGSVLGIKKGDVYNKEELNKRLQYNPNGSDVSSLYMDDGYLFFQIDPVEVLVEGDSIDIEMRVREGAQARIKEVTVSGNTKTSDHVILRELYTIPGQKFSRSDLIRSQREIATLGYFDPEQIGMNPIPNQEEGTVDIKYTVTEKPSDQITLSGGWGGPYGIVGTVGLVLNNFSLKKAGDPRNWRPIPGGDGQRLALNIQANGLRYQSYSLSFTEPWLGGRKRNSFSVGINRTVSRTISNGEELQGIRINGGSVSLGRRLSWPDNYFSLSHSLSYNQYITKNYPIFGANYQSGTLNSISFINTLSRSSIDQLTFPRSGSTLSLSLNLTPPYSLFDENRDAMKWIEFNKWMLDASFFTSLTRKGKLVLNTRAHFGFLGSYRKDQAVGPVERFKLGGSGLGGGNILVGTEYIGLRGYEDESVSPSSQGGVAYNKFVTELRYLVSPNPQATVYVLGFAEAGNNFGSIQQYSPFKLYRSAGIGARIFMAAFGLLGFDYGWGFDKVPAATNVPATKPGGMFHFIIGQQIR
ncbi:outer membrane protein assembly factor BamA [Adhaeribacter radiodurans]|uniref:Outer membrane protein assembly factor BamA n=1 Tax=Adhaeribacter radiodurans TaxID=2745197 RepID=A0A7L7L2H6_9BACT|nr:outer membrane protein assembly factor BamA [Adhaeribacter radiodurans]QMU26996.1 outer membrane protein assembly factor BamA [Adhaeribacter radiodurans]